MMKCELCGGKADFVDHYEEHIDLPRRINICRSCHSSIEGHHVLKRVMVGKSIMIREDQEKFIKDSYLSLSRFVQDKLDERMEERGGGRQSRSRRG